MLINAIPKGEMFTFAYYIGNILTEIVVGRGERDEKRSVMHADNARPHTAKVTKTFCDDNFLRIAPHPPYSLNSSDLAPSYFLTFLVWASQKPPPMTGIQVCR
jgi:hypothetical protein